MVEKTQDQKDLLKALTFAQKFKKNHEEETPEEFREWLNA